MQGNEEPLDISHPIHKGMKKLQIRNKVKIFTQFKKNDLETRDEYPCGLDEEGEKERQEFKYYCPICLRYFNQILISQCCNNYICRFCIG